jgi:hypothetical protein
MLRNLKSIVLIALLYHLLGCGSQPIYWNPEPDIVTLDIVHRTSPLNLRSNVGLEVLVADAYVTGRNLDRRTPHITFNYNPRDVLDAAWSVAAKNWLQAIECDLPVVTVRVYSLNSEHDKYGEGFYPISTDTSVKG